MTDEARSRNMAAIKNKDTKIEVILRKALYAKGYRYRKNYKDLPGKPDIVLTKYKIAIFCDSEFFHGYDWDNRKNDFKSNREFWIPKIERNMKRDRDVDRQLKGMGWRVVRFWGKDITKNIEECISTIDQMVFDIKTNDN
ncbi:MAG: very short patch repair endonuclease [Parasporobacterium sp.]|nr:very short patch repair endonuclease [Parasporobacterium sp.]